MFDLPENFRRIIERGDSQPSTLVELRPLRAVMPDGPVFDLDFESTTVGRRQLDNKAFEAYVPNTLPVTYAPGRGWRRQYYRTFVPEDQQNTTPFVAGNNRPYATEFNGVDSICYFLGGAGITTTEVTLGFSFRADSLHAADIIAFHDDFVSVDRVRVRITAAGFFRIDLAGGFTVTTAATYKANTWHRVTVWLNNAVGVVDYEIYVDGVITDFGSLVGAALVSTWFGFDDTIHMYVGSIITTNVFAGRIERMLFWNRNLTVDEQADFNDCLKGPFRADNSTIRQDGIANSLIECTPISNSIDPLTRSYSPGTLNLTFGNDGFLDWLVAYSYLTVEVTVWLDFPNEELEEDERVLMFSGCIKDMTRDTVRIVLQCEEWSIDLSEPLGGTDCTSLLLGHPGEVLQEIFWALRVPRDQYDRESLIPESNLRYSHYQVLRDNTQNESFVRGNYNATKFVEYTNTDTAAAVNDLLASCHANLIPNARGKLEFSFYDEDKASVKHLDQFIDAPIQRETIRVGQLKVLGAKTEGRLGTKGSGLRLTISAQVSLLEQASNTLRPRFVNNPVFELGWIGNIQALHSFTPAALPFDIQIIGSPSVSGMGLAPLMRQIGGTQDTHFALDGGNERVMYFAMLWAPTNQFDGRVEPEDRIFNVEFLKIESITGYPDWINRYTPAGVIDPDFEPVPPLLGVPTGPPIERDDVFPYGPVVGDWPNATYGYACEVTERGVLGTPEATSGIHYAYSMGFDVTPFVETVQKIFNRCGNGAPRFEFVVGLEHIGLQLGDFITFTHTAKLFKGSDADDTLLIFEIVLREISASKPRSIRLEVVYVRTDTIEPIDTSSWYTRGGVKTNSRLLALFDGYSNDRYAQARVAENSSFAAVTASGLEAEIPGGRVNSGDDRALVRNGSWRAELVASKDTYVFYDVALGHMMACEVDIGDPPPSLPPWCLPTRKLETDATDVVDDEDLRTYVTLSPGYINDPSILADGVVTPEKLSNGGSGTADTTDGVTWEDVFFVKVDDDTSKSFVAYLTGHIAAAPVSFQIIQVGTFHATGGVATADATAQVYNSVVTPAARWIASGDSAVLQVRGVILTDINWSAFVVSTIAP